MIEPLATLEFVWSFIAPALSDRVKDIFKRRSSPEEARKKAFALYSAMGEVRLSIENFIEALHGHLANYRRWNEAKGTEAQVELWSHLVISQQPVIDSAESVLASLLTLTKCLADVDPQLGIHKPELVRALAGFQFTEASIAGKVVDAVLMTDEQPIEVLGDPTSSALEDIARVAELQRAGLIEAIDDFRQFLVSEFTFKESF